VKPPSCQGRCDKEEFLEVNIKLQRKVSKTAVVIGIGRVSRGELAEPFRSFPAASFQETTRGCFTEAAVYGKTEGCVV